MEFVQQVIDGVNKLIELEKKLEKGEEIQVPQGNRLLRPCKRGMNEICQIPGSDKAKKMRGTLNLI